MPQMTFAPENKSEDPTAFPKVRLEKDGRARIACLENPEYGFTHRLAAPKLVNDKPVYETSDRTGASIMVMDFIGRPTCIGDLGVLRDKGSDPAHCPACRKARESDRVGPAQRRFAMHVVEYGLKPNGFIVADPFSISIKVWAYADSIFNKLSDFMQEWGPLSKHDLNLGPCTNVGFQKYEIAISAQAIWLVGGGGLTAKETQQMTARAFKSQRAPDLSVFLGRKVPESFMLEDIARVENRWRLVDKYLGGQGPGEAAPEDHDAALAEGLATLLDENPAAAALPPAGTDLDVEALLAGTGIMEERESFALTGGGTGIDSLPGQVPMEPEQNGSVSLPTAQDVADVRELQEQVAASSAAAKAAPAKTQPQEIDLADILGAADTEPAAVETVLPPPATPAPTAPTSAASTAPPGKADPEELDFEAFLKEFGAES